MRKETPNHIPSHEELSNINHAQVRLIQYMGDTFENWINDHSENFRQWLTTQPEDMAERLAQGEEEALKQASAYLSHPQA